MTIKYNIFLFLTLAVIHCVVVIVAIRLTTDVTKSIYITESQGGDPEQLSDGSLKLPLSKEIYTGRVSSVIVYYFLFGFIGLVFGLILELS